MSIPNLLLRFTLAYVVLMVVLSIIVAMIGLEKPPTLNFPVLFCSIAWVCLTFAKKNRRYLTKGEKAAVVFGMLSIDLFIQCIISYFLLLKNHQDTSAPAIIIAVIFVGSLDLLVIYLTTSFQKRLLIRQGLIEN